jgi:hypothetical protein
MTSWLKKLDDIRSQARAEAGAPAGDNRPFVERLHDIAEATEAEGSEDPWLPVLRKVRGHISPDGNAERVSTGRLFDLLGIPIPKRRALSVRLSKAMCGLGWRHIREHGLNDQGFLSRVRGFSRPVKGSRALM